MVLIECMADDDDDDGGGGSGGECKNEGRGGPHECVAAMMVIIFNTAQSSAERNFTSLIS